MCILGKDCPEPYCETSVSKLNYHFNFNLCFYFYFLLSPILAVHKLCKKFITFSFIFTFTFRNTFILTVYKVYRSFYTFAFTFTVTFMFILDPSPQSKVIDSSHYSYLNLLRIVKLKANNKLVVENIFLERLNAVEWKTQMPWVRCAFVNVYFYFPCSPHPNGLFIVQERLYFSLSHHHT